MIIPSYEVIKYGAFVWFGILMRQFDCVNQIR